MCVHEQKPLNSKAINKKLLQLFIFLIQLKEKWMNEKNLKGIS